MTEFSEDNLTDAAAALTYYAVLSIFPALLAMVSIVGLVGDPQTIIKVLTDVVSSIGPASAVDTFKGPIEGLTKSSGTAGLMVIVGIASALWTASGYVGAFMRASNVIYEVEEGRSFIKLRPLQMLVTLVLVVLLALVLVVAGADRAGREGRRLGRRRRRHRRDRLEPRQVAGAVRRGGVHDHGALLRLAERQARGPQADPARRRAGDRRLAGGLGWRFAFYVANFGSYNKTYGALGGVIVFLVWLWITNVAILLGRGAQRRARAQPPARRRTSPGPSASSSSRSARRRRRRSARGPRER